MGENSVSVLILDLNKGYLEKNRKFIKGLKNKYVVLNYDSESERNEIYKNAMQTGIAVITDDESAGEKWKNYAVIAVEHKTRICGVDFVTEELESIDDTYINLVYVRKFELPLIVKETPNLIIREITMDDVPELCKLYEENKFNPFLEPLHDVEQEKEITKAYINNMYRFYGYGMWVVIHKKDNRIIGRAGIEHRILNEKIVCELGYFISADYQRKGYGFEAAAAVVDYAKEHEMKELVACIDENNSPSIRLAVRLGFVPWQSIVDGERTLHFFKNELDVFHR